jgi:uncharacterized membrane-anchored protein
VFHCRKILERAFRRVAEAGILAGLKSHPMRAALTQEMHVRRLPPLRIPAHVLQIVALLGRRPEDAERHIASIGGGEGPAPGARYHRCRIGEVELVWERHTEFCTYTLLAEGDTDPPFSQGLFGEVDRAWVQAIPAEVIRASHVVLIPQNPDRSEKALISGLAEDSVVCCDLGGGMARMYSDFKLHAEGNGRLLIVDRGLTGIEPGQLLRRLLELGNYRKMALLGLPVAQAGMLKLEQLEKRLVDLTAAVANAGTEPGSLLEELTGLSAEIARLSAETGYRMSASSAYGQLVDERLSALEVESVRGFLSLADFTERRLHPALRTCATFSSRLSDLATRAEWTSALMRTRVETALTAQNRDLLASMDRRASIQLRLQETVEGLSVVAISYYGVGLLGYVAKPFLEAFSVPAEWFTAAAVAIALAGTWTALHIMRRRWALSRTAGPKE